MSASTEDFQRRLLRRNRLIATALLGAVAALFIAANVVPQPGFWILLVRTTAEAAVVGALADWFAVAALFRRPLGLPIPHTAIVPRSKDRIGEGLATFIEHNFLTPELIRAKLRAIDPARLLADWLACPTNADALADRLLRVMPHLLGAVDDRDIRDFISSTLGRQLGTVDLAPILGRAITVLIANGHHERLIDRLLDLCGEFLTNREDQLYAAAEIPRRRWWIPKAVNRQIAKAIVAGIREIISNLREPGTSARQNLVRGIEHLAQELSTSPEYQAHIEEVKQRLLEDPETRLWLGSIWDNLERALRADLVSPTSQVRQAFAVAVRSLGQDLLAQPELCGRLNRTIEALVTKAIPWRERLVQFIIEVVRRWDTKSFAERLELVVGRDLQYIRINGTLVGGLVGCLLYLVSAALR